MDYIASVSSYANSDSSECALVFNAHTESYEWLDSNESARTIKKKYVTRDGYAVRYLSDLDIEKYPRYVQRCIKNKYSFKVTNKATGEVKYFVAGCNSWRCPVCNRKVGARDYRKLLAAFQARDIVDAVALTITLDQHRERLKNNVNAAKSYGVLTKKVKAFITRLRKHYGPVEYAYCVESHKSGWGHVNLTIFNKEMADDARRSGEMLSPPWLMNHIKKTKLGNVYSKLVYSYDGLAGYMIKTAYGDSLDGQIAEMNKTSQLPVNAPKGFRRIKTSVRFWTPYESKKKNPDTVCEFVSRGPTAEQMNKALAYGKDMAAFLEQTADRHQLQPEGSTNVAGEASEAEKDAVSHVIASIVPVRPARLVVTEEVKTGTEGQGSKEVVGKGENAKRDSEACTERNAVVLYLSDFKQRRLHL